MDRANYANVSVMYIGVGTGGGTGGMCPPMFHKLLYKLFTTLCVLSDCAPPPPSKSLSYTSDVNHKQLLPHHTLERDCSTQSGDSQEDREFYQAKTTQQFHF